MKHLAVIHLILRWSKIFLPEDLHVFSNFGWFQVAAVECLVMSGWSVLLPQEAAICGKQKR